MVGQSGPYSSSSSSSSSFGASNLKVPIGYVFGFGAAPPTAAKKSVHKGGDGGRRGGHR